MYKHQVGHARETAHHKGAPVREDVCFSTPAVERFEYKPHHEPYSYFVQKALCMPSLHHIFSPPLKAKAPERMGTGQS